MSVAGTPKARGTRSRRARVSNVGVVDEDERAGRSLRADRLPELVVHRDRRPRVRDERRRLERRVADHDRRVGVHAAHRAAVDAEQHHVTAFEGRAAGEHLRGELHTLAADPGEQQLTFQGRIPSARTRPDGSTSARTGLARCTSASFIDAHRQLVDGVGVVLRVADGSCQRRAQRRHQPVARTLRSRRGTDRASRSPFNANGRVAAAASRVARLREHALDPPADLSAARLDVGHALLEVPTSRCRPSSSSATSSSSLPRKWR